MATQSQIQANRLNAQKSTGPRTSQGKAAIAQNALKHGLSACRDVIITESQEEFDRHRQAFLAELAPEGPTESFLAERIVTLSWRLKRADSIQNQTIDAIHEQENSPLKKRLNSLYPKHLRICEEDLDPALTLGRLILKDFAGPKVLDRLLMYERRIEHSLFKTLLELKRLTLLKTLNPPEPQIPAESSEIASDASQIAPAPSVTEEQENPSPNARLAAGPVPAVTKEQNKPLEKNRLSPGPVPAVPAEHNNSPRPQSHPTARRPRAKQTQFQKPTNPHNPLPQNHLQQNPPRPAEKKQTQSNPISLPSTAPAPYNSRTVPKGPIRKLAIRESRIQGRHEN